MKHLEIRPLEDRDIEPMAAAFRVPGWDKPRLSTNGTSPSNGKNAARSWLPSRRCLRRVPDINWSADYTPFREAGIPEIQDFNVLPRFRREGVGTRPVDEAERTISQRSSIAGIGAGMSPDYGAAQRLYALRGYVPDGRGLLSEERQLSRGDTITVDDGLTLHPTKELTAGSPPEKPGMRPVAGAGRNPGVRASE